MVARKAWAAATAGTVSATTDVVPEGSEEQAGRNARRRLARRRFMGYDRGMSDSIDRPYDFQDYKAAFMVVVQAMITKQGISMVDEGHFRALATNAGTAALAIARELKQEQKRYAAAQNTSAAKAGVKP